MFHLDYLVVVILVVCFLHHLHLLDLLHYLVLLHHLNHHYHLQVMLDYDHCRIHLLLM
tara:strand:+ start:375 stop:548 length:174 start_codon:yes stop_codon:yes gene_type:complete